MNLPQAIHPEDILLLCHMYESSPKPFQAEVAIRAESLPGLLSRLTWQPSGEHPRRHVAWKIRNQVKVKADAALQKHLVFLESKLCIFCILSRSHTVTVVLHTTLQLFAGNWFLIHASYQPEGSCLPDWMDHWDTLGENRTQHGIRFWSKLHISHLSLQHLSTWTHFNRLHPDQSGLFKQMVHIMMQLAWVNGFCVFFVFSPAIL